MFSFGGKIVKPAAGKPAELEQQTSQVDLKIICNL